MIVSYKDLTLNTTTSRFDAAAPVIHAESSASRSMLAAVLPSILATGLLALFAASPAHDDTSVAGAYGWRIQANV